MNKLYVHSLVQYNKVLVQRNKLLKELAFRPDYGETLDVWDMQLVNYGKEVMEYRGDFVCRLNEMIHGIHARLSGQKEDLKICYEPDTAAAQFEEALKRSRTQDMKQKTTLCGPHRDDISFFVNGIDIRKFGSQGQQRTAALSLKLSELELVKQLIHDRPILLLDDVLSELDAGRQNHLLNAINDIQTIITCTGLDDFVNNRFKIDKIFKVIDGAVVSEN